MSKAIASSILTMLLAAVSALAAEPSPPATGPTTQPSEIRNGPIHYWQETRSNPPLHLHMATVDLQDPVVTVQVRPAGDDPDGAGPWQTTLMPVRQIAERDGMDLAVNGNFFISKDVLMLGGRKMPYLLGNWSKAAGWAMSDGKLWSIDPAVASLMVDSQGHLHIGRFDRIPGDAREVVSGSQMLVMMGRNVGGVSDVSPRTAVGIDSGGHTLVFLVVDGRRPEYSAGMTTHQLAEEMIRLGCDDALNLDGGGSSAMVLRDPTSGTLRVMNRPSDGHDLPIPMSLERSVADALGVKVKR